MPSAKILPLSALPLPQTIIPPLSVVHTEGDNPTGIRPGSDAVATTPSVPSVEPAPVEPPAAPIIGLGSGITIAGEEPRLITFLPPGSHERKPSLTYRIPTAVKPRSSIVSSSYIPLASTTTTTAHPDADSFLLPLPNVTATEGGSTSAPHIAVFPIVEAPMSLSRPRSLSTFEPPSSLSRPTPPIMLSRPPSFLSPIPSNQLPILLMDIPNTISGGRLQSSSSFSGVASPIAAAPVQERISALISTFPEPDRAEGQPSTEQVSETVSPPPTFSPPPPSLPPSDDVIVPISDNNVLERTPPSQKRSVSRRLHPSSSSAIDPRLIAAATAANPISHQRQGSKVLHPHSSSHNLLRSYKGTDLLHNASQRNLSLLPSEKEKIKSAQSSFLPHAPVKPDLSKMSPYIRVTLLPSHMSAQTSVSDHAGTDAAWKTDNDLELPYEGLFKTLAKQQTIIHRRRQSMFQSKAGTSGVLHARLPSMMFPDGSTSLESAHQAATGSFAANSLNNKNNNETNNTNNNNINSPPGHARNMSHHPSQQSTVSQHSQPRSHHHHHHHKHRTTQSTSQFSASKVQNGGNNETNPLTSPLSPRSRLEVAPDSLHPSDSSLPLDSPHKVNLTDLVIADVDIEADVDPSTAAPSTQQVLLSSDPTAPLIAAGTVCHTPTSQPPVMDSHLGLHLHTHTHLHLHSHTNSQPGGTYYSALQSPEVASSPHAALPTELISSPMVVTTTTSSSSITISNPTQPTIPPVVNIFTDANIPTTQAGSGTLDPPPPSTATSIPAAASVTVLGSSSSSSALPTANTLASCIRRPSEDVVGGGGVVTQSQTISTTSVETPPIPAPLSSSLPVPFPSELQPEPKHHPGRTKQSASWVVAPTISNHSSSDDEDENDIEDEDELEDEMEDKPLSPTHHHHTNVNALAKMLEEASNPNSSTSLTTNVTSPRKLHPSAIERVSSAGRSDNPFSSNGPVPPTPTFQRTQSQARISRTITQVNPYPSLLIEAFAVHPKRKPGLDGKFTGAPMKQGRQDSDDEDDDDKPPDEYTLHPDILIGSCTVDLLSYLQNPFEAESYHATLSNKENRIDHAGQVRLTIEYCPHVESENGIVPMFSPGMIKVHIRNATHLTDQSVAKSDHSLLLKSFFLMLLYLASGITFYTMEENWSFLDAFYFCL